MNNICAVINKNHHSIMSTFLVCINYVWFTLDQPVLLPISCTQSSRANFTDTDSHARNMIRKQFRYISFVFLSLSNEALPKCRKKLMWCILRNIRRRIAKKLIAGYLLQCIHTIVLISLTY